MIISRDVSWMCPSSLIENVPSKWNKINIALYHIYFEGCSLQQTDIQVFAAPMTKLHEKQNTYTKIWTKRFDRNEIAQKPKDEPYREHLVALDVPSEICSDGPYFIQLFVRAESPPWKRNWGFEGFGVT